MSLSILSRVYWDPCSIFADLSKGIENNWKSFPCWKLTKVNKQQASSHYTTFWCSYNQNIAFFEILDIQVFININPGSKIEWNTFSYTTGFNRQVWSCFAIGGIFHKHLYAAFKRSIFLQFCFAPPYQNNSKKVIFKTVFMRNR